MFLKSLTIADATKVIRKINFKYGINLIIDESTNQITGNNVGKTTVLKLIDFCLGGNPKNIYVDPETKRNEYKEVKEFLIENEVKVTLVLAKDIHTKSKIDITIERNFLSRKQIIRRINGYNYTEDEFELKLLQLIFPDNHLEKPTFRQIISHNIRYKDQTINNTLKTLDTFTTDAEYETLYLFLLGCSFNRGNKKQEILAKLKLEKTFKKRLEKEQTKTAYETAISLLDSEIKEINRRKTNLNLNENFKTDLENLNLLKYQINKISSEISRLNIRKDIIIDAEKDLASNKSNIDLQQLQLIYSQATNQIENIQKTFTELVNYHNNMILEKIKFIAKELPELKEAIQIKKSQLSQLLLKEKSLSENIAKTDSFEELESLITALTEKFRKKGEYENIVAQISNVELDIKTCTKELNEIDEELFSDEFELVVKTQVNKFNLYFSKVSMQLYGEQYALKYDIITDKNNRRLYKFGVFSTNLSSGKKQGEISCFDIAYILFADAEHIKCLHFILNDKKELMHDNQLVKITELVNLSKVQFVAAILKDKLPPELNNEKYFVVRLSQEDKLFKIEDR